MFIDSIGIDDIENMMFHVIQERRGFFLSNWPRFQVQRLPSQEPASKISTNPRSEPPEKVCFIRNTRKPNCILS